MDRKAENSVNLLEKILQELIEKDWLNKWEDEEDEQPNNS